MPPPPPPVRRSQALPLQPNQPIFHSVPPSKRPEAVAGGGPRTHPPLTYTDPRTGYPHTVNAQYSNLLVANNATPEVEEFVRGAILHLGAATLASVWQSTSDAARDWFSIHPDVPFLDPRGVSSEHLTAFILEHLVLLTPEEAHEKRTGAPPGASARLRQ